MQVNSKSLIDIIVPAFNSDNYIEKTLDSVFNQTFQDYKIYVIDDNSSDGTSSILKKLGSKINLIKLKKNKGPAFCRNIGMRVSNSNYLCFLDSDDLWTKDKLLKQYKFMEKLNLDFSYTNYVVIDQNDKIKSKVYVKNYTSVNEFMCDTSIATSSLMLKRSFIDNLKFKKKGYGFDDYIFKCEILLKTKNSKCLNDYLLNYRVRKNSISSKPFRNFVWIWKINRDYFKLPFLINLKNLFSISISSLLKYRLNIILRFLKNKTKKKY